MTDSLVSFAPDSPRHNWIRYFNLLGSSSTWSRMSSTPKKKKNFWKNFSWMREDIQEQRKTKSSCGCDTLILNEVHMYIYLYIRKSQNDKNSEDQKHQSPGPISQILYPMWLGHASKEPKVTAIPTKSPKQVNQIKKKTSLDTKAALNPSRQNH